MACNMKFWDVRFYLSFFVMLDEFFGWETVKVAEFWFDHDRQVTQRLFDDSFGNAINRPTHVCLGKHTKKILVFFKYWCLLTGFALGTLETGYQEVIEQSQINLHIYLLCLTIFFKTL